MFNDTFKSIEPNVVDGSLTVRTKCQGQDDMVIRIIGNEGHDCNIVRIEAPGGAQLEVVWISGALHVAVPKNDDECWTYYEHDDEGHSLDMVEDNRH